MISSGGMLYRDQPRFHREDTSYRRIPIDARPGELSVWHFGYPTRDAEQPGSGASEITSPPRMTRSGDNTERS